MAYLALYRRTIIASESLGTKEVNDSNRDAFAVCELPFIDGGLTPLELLLHIRDECNGVDIISYDYKRISAGEFDYFLAFDCGPEAKSRIDDDDDTPRLYIS